MANTFTAPFGQTPKTVTQIMAYAGTTNTNTPTNSKLIVTAGENGALVTSVSIIPRATTSAGRINLFISVDAGTNKVLFTSVEMPSQTVNTTTAPQKTVFSDITEATPMRLQAGATLYVNSAVALSDGIACTAQSTDF